MNRVVRALLNSRAVKFVVDIRTFATRKTSCVVFRGAYLRDRYKLGMDRFFAEHDPAARTRLRTRLAHHMRTAERRVGKESVSTCRYRWSTSHSKKKQETKVKNE